MRWPCGTSRVYGETKRLWICDKPSTGAKVGFFADVALYSCDDCRKREGTL